MSAEPDTIVRAVIWKAGGFVCKCGRRGAEYRFSLEARSEARGARSPDFAAMCQTCLNEVARLFEGFLKMTRAVDATQVERVSREWEGQDEEG